MTLKEHKKHTALIKPAMGNFGRNEWAIIGAPCAEVGQLATSIIAALSPVCSIAYVDARHHNEPDVLSPRLTAGAITEYTTLNNGRQTIVNEDFGIFQNRETLNNADMILLNGNHHQGVQQIVVIDPRKRESLHKRLHQLTNVLLFLLAGDETEPFDFLKDAIPQWQDIPIYRFSETRHIIAFMQAAYQQNIPPLSGLVLAGGKSERMGTDKGAIPWHGKEQRYHAANLLRPFCSQIFISCRSEQQSGIKNGYTPLTDTFTGLGPFGAILSAFRQQPDSAWLIIACDLPLLDQHTLQQLAGQRSPRHLATAFKSTNDGLPEPLVAIWEPKSYAVLLSFLAQGYSCPRKVLINTNSCIIAPPNPQALTNVNTPQEMEQMKALLNRKTLSSA